LRDAEVTGASDWTTNKLAEFLALLAAAADGEAVVGDTLERLADAFDADAGALLTEDGVTSSLG
jgi:hypothetical protein